MTIDVVCPHCGARTEVADQCAGQSEACKACGQKITVPGVAPTTVQAPPPSSPSSNSPVIVVLAVLGIAGFLGCGILVALLLPATQAAREAALRMQCSNHLKRITLALHMYQDARGTYPPAYIADENGKPMHSWRVLILPYMEQQALYAQYDLSNPWDSPENLAITEQIIPEYSCPSDTQAPRLTNYMLVTGPDTMFDGAKSIGWRNVTDGNVNTILVVEVTGRNVHWAEPKDVAAAEYKQLIVSGSASQHPPAANLAFSDGHVAHLDSNVDPATIDALITPAGGENVDLN